MWLNKLKKLVEKNFKLYKWYSDRTQRCLKTFHTKTGFDKVEGGGGLAISALIEYDENNSLKSFTPILICKNAFSKKLSL